MPLPFLGPGDLARAGLDRATPSPSPTRWPPRRPCCARRCCPGLLKSLAYNESHRNAGVGLFEIGHVFRRRRPAQPLPDEREMLAAVRAGADAMAAAAWWRELEQALALGGAELARRPSSPACTRPAPRPSSHAGGEVLGAVGEIDPGVLDAHGIAERVASLELDLERLLAVPARRRAVPPGQPLPVERPRPGLRRPRRRAGRDGRPVTRRCRR